MNTTATKPQPEVPGGPSVEVVEAGARSDLFGRLGFLWGQRRFLFWSAVVGLVGATMIAFMIPKSYESTTRLMPPDTQTGSSLAMAAGLSGQLGGFGALAGEALGIKSSGALFVGVLNSQTVGNRLVQRFDLKAVYGVRLEQDAQRKLAERTSVAEDRKSGIIAITVTDRSAQRATGIATAYVEELDRLVSQLSTSAAHRERVFLEERLESVKQDLDAASERFGQFASKNTAIDIQAQGRAMVDAAARLQGELIAAQSELEMYKQVYTENNVRVRAAEARIAELQRQLEKLGGAQVNGKIGSPEAADPLYPSIRELPLLGIRYADLLRRTKIEETVYGILTQQYELAKVEEAKETPSVRILDPAAVPGKKSFPPRLIIMFLGTFLSLAFAITWVLASARWQEIDLKDPRKILAHEVLGAMTARLSWLSKNGVGVRAAVGRVWARLRRRPARPESED